MGTINVKDASGATVAVARIPDTGQQAMAGSLPVALASDTALPLPSGAATAANQATLIGHVDALEAATGAQADVAAAADGTGNYGLIAAAKRALLNWATLLARVPALVGGRVPTTNLPSAGSLTNRSGTVSTGGVAQQLMAANAARLGIAVMNLSNADLWINGLGAAAAAQPSMRLVAGAYYESPPGGQPLGAVSIFGATTGQAFSAREW